MLEYLRRKLPFQRKFLIDMEDYGNTVSNYSHCIKNGIVGKAENRILLAGFGVGYSWGAVAIYK
jgi:3-oxoacyl-[acyl-carrier-protein] synthase-3